MFNCSFISKVTVIPNAFASIKYLFQVEHKIQDVVHLNDNLSKVTVIPYAFASVFRQLEAVRALEERTGENHKFIIVQGVFLTGTPPKSSKYKKVNLG